MAYSDDEHTTTVTHNSAGQTTSKSIQGRALDPSGELAVQEKMRTTDLGALARAAAAKKAGAGASKEVQKKALSPEERRKQEGEGKK